jgi:hypothetical protein
MGDETRPRKVRRASDTDPGRQRRTNGIYGEHTYGLLHPDDPHLHRRRRYANGIPGRATASTERRGDVYWNPHRVYRAPHPHRSQPPASTTTGHVTANDVRVPPHCHVTAANAVDDGHHSTIPTLQTAPCTSQTTAHLAKSTHSSPTASTATPFMP